MNIPVKKHIVLQDNAGNSIIRACEQQEISNRNAMKMSTQYRKEIIEIYAIYNEKRSSGKSDTQSTLCIFEG